MMQLQQALKLGQSINNIKNSSTSHEFSILKFETRWRQSARMCFRSIPITSNVALPMATSWSLMAVCVQRAILDFVI